MKKLTIFISGFIAISPFLYGETKTCDLAGKWYPESKQKLTAEIQKYLNNANPPKFKNKIIGIISPHAGIEYSGLIAAFSYKAIKNQNREIKTAIVIGFNHRVPHKGIAVCDSDYYQTPLGKVKIDTELTKKLLEYDKNIYSMKKAFQNENSSEMQIPFIQTVLENTKLVIIHIGKQSLNNCELLSQALYENLKSRDSFLLIGSTDMCHFLPYKQTNRIDEYTISVIKEFNPQKLFKASKAKHHRLMCGYGAVCTLMMTCKKLGASDIKILKYLNSGDTTYNKSNVVGYLSAAITNSKNNGRSNTEDNNKEEEYNMGLSQNEKEKLMHIAQTTLENYLSSGEKPNFEIESGTLTEKRGAFVTLKNNGRLRGCIGNMIGRGPLYKTIENMAIEAATGDPRFPKVTSDELNEISVEISVLSPLEKVESPDEIKLGRDGVIVKKGLRQGVFLPQVATETGWSKEEFLSQLCAQKAGLPPAAWKEDPEVELYKFSATVFSEEEVK